MQRLTIFDTLRLVQAAYPDKIAMYNQDDTEFYLADTLAIAKDKVGLMKPMVNYPTFLESTNDYDAYIMILSEKTSALVKAETQ